MMVSETLRKALQNPLGSAARKIVEKGRLKPSFKVLGVAARKTFGIKNEEEVEALFDYLCKILRSTEPDYGYKSFVLNCFMHLEPSVAQTTYLHMLTGNLAGITLWPNADQDSTGDIAAA